MPLKDKLRSRSAADLREERDLLGFVRREAVRWLEPALLLKAGVEVIVSGTFGRFADKREIQRDAQGPFDYSGRAGELWIDCLSDTGDGWEATYTMAYLAAQPSLDVAGETLPRGQLLLLGGDEVYPTASAQAYEDRFKGPFACALPRSDPGSEPHMYALPGNHDWYDGLVSFLRLFCTEGWIGGWRTRQRRSYFALRLPGDWWILGIDIQLDTYIDDVQLDYFRAQAIMPGDKVILVTSIPSWTHAYDGRAEPASWRYLSYFEQRMIRDRGARLVVAISGDTHHYARFDPAADDATQPPTRITAGGGGAYLSATHTLRHSIELTSLARATGSGAQQDPPSQAYTRERIYPSDRVSRRLSAGILGLARFSPGFGRLLGGVYAVIALSMLGALNGAGGGLVHDATADGFAGFLANAAGGLALVLALALLVAIHGATEIKLGPLERRGQLPIALARLAVSLAHTLLHLLTIALVVWAAVKLAPEVGHTAILVWVIALAGVCAAGAVVGPTLFGAFLLLVHRWRGAKAHGNANLVFSAQAIGDYKNFVRMRLARDGGLTVYALGVDRAGREWDHVGDDVAGARFVPRVEAPAVRLVDGPLHFDPAGDRVR